MSYVTIQFDVAYVPREIIDWLEEEQLVKEHIDFNWYWSDAHNHYLAHQFQLRLSEQMALMTILKWGRKYQIWHTT